nr:helix-turn-helix domain-containing protein [uncultured Oscillibacter sp.]
MRKNMNDDFYDSEDLEIENEYLTPREVMDLLYIGRNTFYKLVNSGELPAFRIGKLWRVSRKALEEFCA